MAQQSSACEEILEHPQAHVRLHSHLPPCGNELMCLDENLQAEAETMGRCSPADDGMLSPCSVHVPQTVHAAGRTA